MKNRLLVEEIDPKILNFLIRRVTILERNLRGNWDDDLEPLKFIEYSFDGLHGYGFNSYDSKKIIEGKIIEMLYENDLTDYIYEMDENDPERKKIIKTIRKFLNFVLVDKK